MYFGRWTGKGSRITGKRELDGVPTALTQRKAALRCIVFIDAKTANIPGKDNYKNQFRSDLH